MDEMVHRWESRGYGKAPFKVVGIAEIPSKGLAEANPEAYMNALRSLPQGFGIGQCGICGMPLTVNYLIRDAEGRQFSVGCECVQKAGQANMIAKVKALELARQRKIREEKREAARLADLQAQKDRNGGLLDWEVKERDRKAEEARLWAANEARRDVLAKLADLLDDRRGGFCTSVAEGLRQGQLPKGRGLGLMLEILGKQAGRMGSKAYEARVAEIEDMINNLPEEVK